MKSIALIYLPNKEKLDYGSGVVRARIPYPLIHLGSYLKNNGITVYLIDGQVCDAKEELEKIIDKLDIIGFSVMTMQVANSLELSEYIKEKYPNKKIIWGGIHPSLLPEQTVKDKSIDYVCQREGEGCLLDLCNDIPLKEIKNLVYKEKGKVIVNPIREFIDLNKEDKPIWDIMDLEPYIKLHKFGPKKGKRAFGISVGRGCVFNCSYCVNGVLGRRWRSLSAEEMVKRIKFLTKKYDIGHFTIVDDCFDIDMNRVKEFCNRIIKEKIKITWEVNVRAGKQWTNEVMKLIKQSGCILLCIGAESGSERVLKEVYHRTVTIEDIIYTAKQCKKYNILLATGWMGGVPNETEEDAKKTLDLIKKLVEISPNTIISGPAPFRPYPNSELYFEAVKQGYREPKSLKEWAENSNEGYLSEENLPWVKNPKRLKAIEFYCVNAYRYPINFAHKVLIALCKLRLKYNFYAIPWEIPVTRFYVTKIYED
jgi:radical SAM superfamily enzyme YgiQ (UPF0313 family)